MVSSSSTAPPQPLTRSSWELLPLSKKREFLESLTPAEKAVLLYRWDFWAREKQRTPPGDWVVWLILSGRGFGKTRTGAQWIIERAKSGLYRRFALIGETAADVRDVMIEGDSGILACSPPWFFPRYEPSKRRLTWPNGAIATTFSGEEPKQLRGPQFDSVWADEPAKWQYADDAWDNMEMGLRLGPNPQVVATTTPRPIPLIRKLVADPQTVVTKGHTDENRANLSAKYVERVIRKYEGTRLGRQELAGEILGDNPLALWKLASMIDAHRLKEKPASLAVVAVGVDPQAADPKIDADQQSAETGIVAAGWNGSRTDPHFYVLQDASVYGSPQEWGKAVVETYKAQSANRVVAEQNNGGAMVAFVVQTAAKQEGYGNAGIPYLAVHASRGKQTRAEPVAGLYEQGRVHHVGAFAALEDQMCNWSPGMPSPDRMDALVWVLTHLGELSGWFTSANTVQVVKQGRYR